MYVLDTDVLSELRKRRPHGGVLEWLRSVVDQDLALSAVSFAEIQAGIELTREQDAAKANEIQLWADQLLSSWNVLPMDTQTFRLWARLMHRKSDDLSHDGMIAATAIVHGRVVVTRNVKDFRQFDVEIVNPYAARQ